MLSVCFRHRVRVHPPQELLPLTSKTFEQNLRHWGHRMYRSGKIYWMIFLWHLPEVTVVALIKKIISCPALAVVTLSLLHDNIMEEFCYKLCFAKFSLTISHVSFSKSNTLLDISREWLVRLVWNENVRCIDWILGELFDLDRWPHPWTWPLRIIIW